MIAILTLPPSVPPLPPSPPGNVPPKADLGDLSGLVQGTQGRATAVMINSGEFDGAKAYKDSKVRRVEQGLVGLEWVDGAAPAARVVSELVDGVSPAARMCQVPALVVAASPFSFPVFLQVRLCG